ncbi:MAG TPA: alginate export family protein [Terriglobales bacterium]|nr:alginate export family protein [Terriglobales bacterium]
MQSSSSKLAAVLALCLISAGAAWAQNPPADSPPAAKFPIKVTLQVRLRLESWDWFDTPLADGTYEYFASQVRLGIGQDRESWEWQIELAQPTLLGLPDNAIAPAPQGQLGMGPSYFAANDSERNVAGVFPKQAFVRLKGLGSDRPSRLRLGRFELIEGAETTPKDATLAALKRERIAHRLIGNFAFSHVGRSFDGVEYVRSTPAANFTAMAGRVTQGVFDTHGSIDLDVDAIYGAYTRALHKQNTGEWRAFVLHYHDGRGALKVDNRPLAARQADRRNIRLTTLGGHYLDVFPAGRGRADVLLWGAWQFGDWGALDHRAGAGAVEVGYQPAWTLKPWFRLGYFRSSGDGNPADGEHNTFFQVLPTPRIYARFPFFNLMNNEDAFAELILRPHAKVTLRSDLHWLRLGNARDLWYLGGGAFQDTTFGYAGRPSGGRKSLATMADVSADWKVNSQVSLTFYLGGAFSRSAIAASYPKAGNGRLSYLELNWRR